MYIYNDNSIKPIYIYIMRAARALDTEGASYHPFGVGYFD